jgi:hypothetical protein
VLKLGYKASAEQFAPTKLLDFSIEAEKVELDSVGSMSTAMRRLRWFGWGRWRPGPPA